eukprot:4791806-Pyramimonas_sp.AAC.1
MAKQLSTIRLLIQMMLHALSHRGLCTTSRGMGQIPQAAFLRSCPESCSTDAQRSSRRLQCLSRSAAQNGQMKRLCLSVPGLLKQAWH